MTVYLIHFEQPYWHAQHYLGTAADLAARIAEHQAGTGAKLLAAVNRAGIQWSVVRTWPGSYAQEKALKRRHNGRDLCPVCNPPRLRAPIPLSEQHFDKLDFCSLKRYYQAVRLWRLWMAVKLASKLISRKAELRHTQSIAQHLIAHIYELKNSMESIERLNLQEVKGYPVEKMKERFQRDVDHAIKEMQQVLSDMLPELDNQN